MVKNSSHLKFSSSNAQKYWCPHQGIERKLSCLFSPLSKPILKKPIVVKSGDRPLAENNKDLFWLTAWEQVHFV